MGIHVRWLVFAPTNVHAAEFLRFRKVHRAQSAVIAIIVSTIGRRHRNTMGTFRQVVVQDFFAIHSLNDRARQHFASRARKIHDAPRCVLAGLRVAQDHRAHRDAGDSRVVSCPTCPSMLFGIRAHRELIAGGEARRA